MKNIKIKFLSSRSIGLLLISLSVLQLSFSYNNESIYSLDSKNKRVKLSDSIVLSLTFNGKGAVGLDVSNHLLMNDYLVFTNKSNDTVQIIRQIPRIYKSMTFAYSISFFNKKTKVFNQGFQGFLVGENVDTLKLIFNAKTSLFNKNKYSIDRIYNNYNEISKKIFQQKTTQKNSLKKELDTLYNFYKKKYLGTQYKNLLELNKVYYFDKLQMLYPLSNEVADYLKQLNYPIACSSLSSLLYNYTKNRIQIFNYNKLNTKYYSKTYLELLAKGHFLFLSFEDNKGKPDKQPAINWLKSTNFYKRDSVFLKGKIIPLDNKKFKNKLKDLVLLGSTFNETTFAKIIQQHPSSYYLIDFWATWCAPCIGGIKKMQTMHIPNNVKIISLSVDKMDVKEKWKEKTKQLKQSISYLIKQPVIKNQAFLKFIELNTIPRYILIDKNMNLIDQAFLHPGEPQFLPKLQDVRNSKYW